MSAHSLAYIETPSGVSIFVNDRHYNVHHSHVNYDKVLKYLDKETLSDTDVAELHKLIDVKEAVQDYAGNTITIEDGKVKWKGQVLHNVLTEKLLSLMEKGKPFKSLTLFLENLMKNPSMRSVDQLYEFLSHKGLPITSDGHFLAYKGIRQDWKDCHTASVDNSPGTEHEMERNMVDDNPSNHCSRGYHAGTLSYAQSFSPGGRLVLVKINPKDVVSVPKDHNCEKCRISAYKVLKEHPRDNYLDNTYDDKYDERDFDEDDDDYEEDYDWNGDDDDNWDGDDCPECGESSDDCECE